MSKIAADPDFDNALKRITAAIQGIAVAHADDVCTWIHRSQQRFNMMVSPLARLLLPPLRHERRTSQLNAASRDIHGPLIPMTMAVMRQTDRTLTQQHARRAVRPKGATRHPPFFRLLTPLGAPWGT